MFVYESVPGTTVLNMNMINDGMHFAVEGLENTQITVELEADSEYCVNINGESLGCMKTNLGGKLSFSLDLNPDTAVQVKVDKI